MFLLNERLVEKKFEEFREKKKKLGYFLLHLTFTSSVAPTCIAYTNARSLILDYNQIKKKALVLNERRSWF